MFEEYLYFLGKQNIMKNILVTGASGFLGSYVIEELLKQKFNILALVRAKTPKLDYLAKEISFLKKNISDIDEFDLKGIDAIIHLASAGVSPKIVSIQELFRINVEATANILLKSKLANVKRLIFAGTCHEYGLSAEEYTHIPVEAPLKPVNLYGVSKASGYHVSSYLAKQENVELVYCRIFSAYGDGQHHKNFWPSLKKAALSGEDFLMTEGTQLRDFVPANFVAIQLIEALKNNHVVSGKPLVINIGSGREITLADFAKKEWKRFNAKGKLIIGGLKNRENDLKRLVPECFIIEKNY